LNRYAEKIGRQKERLDTAADREREKEERILHLDDNVAHSHLQPIKKVLVSDQSAHEKKTSVTGRHHHDKKMSVADQRHHNEKKMSADRLRKFSEHQKKTIAAPDHPFKKHSVAEYLHRKLSLTERHHEDMMARKTFIQAERVRRESGLVVSKNNLLEIYMDQDDFDGKKFI